MPLPEFLSRTGFSDKPSERVSYDSCRRLVMQKKLNVLAAWLLAGVLAVVGASTAGAQSNAASGASSLAAAMPKVGDMAPDFTLRYFDDTAAKEISLSQYRGKSNVVVAFFIFAFTGG
jgi:AhpC/TSA family